MKSFFTLIDRLNDAPPAARGVLEQVIWDTFGAERAILALDMSGFSLLARRDGILPYLGHVRRMQRATAPLVAAAGGDVVKYEADNLLAAFPDAPAAVDAAVAIHRKLTADPDHVGVGIGIDYGRFLLVPGADAYGDPVNRAFKLGEDVARAGEILVTQEAADRLGAQPPYRLDGLHVSISGLEFAAHRVVYDPIG